MAACQLEVVASCFSEIGELPSKPTLDVLEGLSICSCTPFKDTFAFQLTEEQLHHICLHHGLVDTLTCIKTILQEATSLYNLLNTSNKWNVPHRGGHASACWNCGNSNHGGGNCKQKKDRKEIAENKKKWEESCGKSSDKEKDGNTGGGHYERKKWGNTKQPASNGVQQFNGVWHMLCNTGCGWNVTHTIGFHNRLITAGQKEYHGARTDGGVKTDGK